MCHATLRLRMMTIVLVAATTLLAACATGASSTTARPTPTAPRTVPPTPLPTVLYRADWSRGAGGWTLPPHWSIKGGALVNDGGGTDPIPVPYAVTAPDYEVDFDAQEVSATQPQNFGNLFGLLGRDTGANQLFEAQILFIGNHTRAPAEWELTANGGGQGSNTAADFVLNNATKTYRVQIHGRGMRLFINSPTAVAGVEGAAPLSPAALFVECQHIQLVITRFEVLAL